MADFVLGNPERFKNVREAGKVLAQRHNIDPYSSVDCIYKALRSKTKKTHGYVVERDDKNGVVLRRIEKRS
jgi:hypothetical protein